MEQCPHCEKKMPMHTLVKHVAKRHPVVPDIVDSDYGSFRWDFQKTEKCATCGEEHPALLMIYHAHIRHGV